MAEHEARRGDRDDRTIVSTRATDKGSRDRERNGRRTVTRAMILAAGEGTRMRPLTDRMPKPMVPIAGRPLLEHTIEKLADAGVREIAINLHAHAGAIADHLGDGSRFGVRIAYSFEPRLLGTAGAVKAMGDFFAGGPFFVVYGDVLARLDFAELLRYHLDRRALATIALQRPDDVRQCGIVELDDDGWITGFVEKPESVEDEAKAWANGGVYVLEPAVLRHIGAGVEQDFGSDVFPALARTERAIAGFRTDGGCLDVGSTGRLRQVDLLFRSSSLTSARRQSIGNAVGDYLATVAGAVDSLDRGCIVRAAELLLDARVRGNCVYIIGNGGSASTASHMAADLSRAALETDGLPLNCRCLSDSMAIVSAWGNDAGFDSVFERQLTQLLAPGDVLVAISASGNSPNIIAAVELARERGAYVLGFSGFGGGLLAKMADVSVVVASGEYGPVEDIHLLLNHLLAAVMRRQQRHQVEESGDDEEREPAYATAAGL